MNCKKCGSLLTENDQFCKNCGASVNEVNAQTQTMGQTSSQTPEQTYSQSVGQTVPSVGVESVPQNSANNNSTVAPTLSPNLMGGQSQPMNQQSWQNGYNSNYNQMPQSPQKNSNTKFIILGVVIVVAIVAITFIVLLVNGGKNNTSGNNSGSNTQQTASKSSYEVNFKGFTFSIPDNLVYEQKGSSLIVGDEAGTWVASFELLEGSFSQMKSNKSQIQGLLQQSGITASSAVEKTLGGVDFITLEVSQSGKNAIMALAKANSMYVFGVTAFNQDNEFDYSLIETIAPIVSTVTYSSSTTNMEGSNFSINGLEGLAK